MKYVFYLLGCAPLESPSARRAWIEITGVMASHSRGLSPSARRAWIEMAQKAHYVLASVVALREEGVD